MHKGYDGISGNRLWLRGVLEPADGSHRSRWWRRVCELGWIDLLVASGARSNLDALLGETRSRREFAGLYEQGSVRAGADRQ